MPRWVMAMSPITDKVELVEAVMRGANPFNRWLLEFDPDAFGSRGRIVQTSNLSKAKRFDSFAAVMEQWKCQSTTVPLRDDGEPNRPLTAYSIEPQKVQN
jgi:hypothetical protein